MNLHTDPTSVAETVAAAAAAEASTENEIRLS